MQQLRSAVKNITPPLIWEATRWVWYAMKDLVQTFGPAVQVRNYLGLTLYFNRGSSIIDRLRAEPVFEEKMCVSIVRDLQQAHDHPVFLDIGANIGLISAFVVTHVPSAMIFAFEPGPKQRELLNMTIAKNNLSDKVIVSSYALSKESGIASFQTHEPRRIANDGFISTGRASNPRTIEVEMITLDTWWSTNNFPKVTAIKIDTEGAELWVLQGSTKMLATTLPTIYLEIEPRNLKVYPYSHDDILDFIHLHNYKLFTLSGVEITKQNFTSYIGKEDTYVARPESRA